MSNQKNKNLTLSIIITLFLSLITLFPSSSSFVAPFPNRQRLQAGIDHYLTTTTRWAVPREEEIRKLLDEAVLSFQDCLEQEAATEEAGSVISEVGKLLYKATADIPEKSSLLQEISKQLDEAVMVAVDDPTVLSEVEAFAIQYHQLVMANVSVPEPIARPNVMDDLILSECQLRLHKFKQSVSGTDSSPVSLIGVEDSSSRGVIVSESSSNGPLDLDTDLGNSLKNEIINDEVDIAIVGAGIGGLCAGAILNTLYGKKVGIYESHYIPGGCAHAFRVSSNNVTFTFDSGPTIVLGCSAPPYNPLRQVLNAVGQTVEWIPYEGWGMIENPGRINELRWKVELGEGVFQKGPISQFGTEKTLEEFEELRKITKGLVSGAVGIPAMAMRAGKSALIPLLRYLPALLDIVKQGELSLGTFAPYMDGPLFIVKDPWLRSWLDALAFSLSGLPASRTSAAAMAYVLFDMHRPGAALDYPRGGLGTVVDALVKGAEQGENGSKVYLRSHVESIDTRLDGGRITGLTLKNGKRVRAIDGVICNAPVWSLNNLIKNRRAKDILNNFVPQKVDRKPRQTWVQGDGINFIARERPHKFSEEDSLLYKCDTSEMTGSFLHLHLAIKTDGLDLSKLEAHYTVMDRSLAGDGSEKDGPYGELNMIAVSNPSVIDKSLAPEGYMVIHAYGAGNEPYSVWKDCNRGSPEYLKLKQKRSQALWRAVESIIPDVRDRIVIDMVGSPITHERFLRRPMGTYGSATEDYLKDGSTPYESLVLAGDGVFPGIGVPAVAISGASAANAFVSPLRQWKVLDKLKREGRI